MSSFMVSLGICRQRAAATYTALFGLIPDTMRSVTVPTHHAFRVPLGRDDGDYFLSISFPPDYEDAETALFRGDELVYNEDWGYGDVRRGFGTGDPSDPRTINALVAEIRRLGMNNPGHPDVSDSEPESEPESEPDPIPLWSPPIPSQAQIAASELLRQGFQQAIADQQTARYGAPLDENPENLENPENDIRQYSGDPQQ